MKTLIEPPSFVDANPFIPENGGATSRGFPYAQEKEYRVYQFELTQHRLIGGVRFLGLLLVAFAIMDLVRLRGLMSAGSFQLITEILSLRLAPLALLATPFVKQFIAGKNPSYSAWMACGVFLMLGICSVGIMLAYYRDPTMQLTPFAVDGIIILIQGVFFPLGLPYRLVLGTSAVLVVFAAVSLYLYLPATLIGQFWGLLPFLLISWMVCAAAGHYLDVATRRQFLLGKELQWAAERDSLTALFNRRMFDTIGERLLAAGRRDSSPVCLLAIDVDYFKAYNDLYGHPQGDSALSALARCMEKFVRRDTDLLARMGGEEFAIVLYGSTLNQARCRAEELREEVASQLALAHAGSPVSGVLTVSIGIACLTGGDTLASLYGRADDALYSAKDMGRNRTATQFSLPG